MSDHAHISVGERPSFRFMRNPRRMTRARGLTLLEMLFCAFIMTLIAVSTSVVLGNGRVMRERARHRAELTLIAQGELDRLRGLPKAQLSEGQQPAPREDWPRSVTVIDTIQKRADGFLEIGVRAMRKSPGGDLKVVLTSLHPGGRR